MQYYCNNCKKEAEMDQNGRCTNCDKLLLADVLNEIISEELGDGDNVLIFVHDNIDGDCVNKKSLQHAAKGHSPIGPTALVLQVGEKFFNALTPNKHDRTDKNSKYGKVILARQTKALQLILQELKRYAVPYCELSSKKEAYRRTVSRGNLLVDNELFVNFD